jgi:hypothetical protein
MNVCPANQAFTAAVHAAGGTKWGIAVTSDPQADGHEVRLFEVQEPRADGDTLRCIDPRRIKELRSSRIEYGQDEARELRRIVERWQGELKLKAPIPVLRLDHFLCANPPASIWAHIYPGGTGSLEVAEVGQRFCMS